MFYTKYNGKGYDDYGNIEYELINGNGKVKEYEVNKLKFEGEYLNGLRNGKGKEYGYRSRLEYEGEYSNGKRNGKGKEYSTDVSHKILFEGEFLNGKRWKGIEKKYDDFNVSIFSSSKNKDRYSYIFEYSEGKRNGKGKEYNINGDLIFEGEYIDKIVKKGFLEKTETMRGKGKEYIKHKNDKLIYEGEYLDGKKWNGKLFDEKGNIICELIDGNGRMNEYSVNGALIFEGEYLNGIRNGKGKEYDLDGNLTFEGEYLEGKRWNGKGKNNYIFGDNTEIVEYLNGEKINNKNNNDKSNFSNKDVIIEQKNKNSLFSFSIFKYD